MQCSVISIDNKPRGTRTFKRRTLVVDEFIRRFLQHVLPRGFVKVRYYGFLSSTVRPKMENLWHYLEEIFSPQEDQKQERAKVVSEKHAACCPTCGYKMLLQGTLSRNGRGPP